MALLRELATGSWPYGECSFGEAGPQTFLSFPAVSYLQVEDGSLVASLLCRIRVEMVMAGRPIRKHQVKVSLHQVDAMEIASFARREGAGIGTFVRRLALIHLRGLQKLGVATVPSPVRDSDKVTFGHHVSVWFTDEEHAVLRHFSTTAAYTVSGYLGRCVLEPWLRMRRNTVTKAAATTQSSRKP